MLRGSAAFRASEGAPVSPLFAAQLWGVLENDIVPPMTAAELHGTTDDALAVVRAQDAAKQMIRRSLGWGGWVITDFVRAERLQASGRSVVLSLRTFDRANVACEVVVRRVLPLESPESQERPGAVIAVVEGSETGLIPTGVGVHYPPRQTPARKGSSSVAKEGTRAGCSRRQRRRR